jgi:hypothetical protein
VVFAWVAACLLRSAVISAVTSPVPMVELVVAWQPL